VRAGHRVRRVLTEPPDVIGGTPPDVIGGTPPDVIGGTPPDVIGGTPPDVIGETLSRNGSIRPGDGLGVMLEAGVSRRAGRARIGEGPATMFTGIVEELGEVVDRVDRPDAALLTVRGPLVTQDAGRGDSIAVDGVCLTVVGVADGAFTADVMRETLSRSALDKIAVGTRVNLERAAALGDRIGGHLVQGHVDGVGTVTGREPSQNWELVRIAIPGRLSRYLVEKGSITVDGVSLTVVECSDEDFTVSLIPTTLELTTLGRKGVGDRVNLEVDVIAKYVERLAAAVTAR
jgi:riboflavin synthase